MRHSTHEQRDPELNTFVHTDGVFEPVRRVRVLLIEDDEDDFLLTRELLLETDPFEPDVLDAYEVEWAPTFEQGLEALASHSHDICLLDYCLGAHDGIELLQESRARGVTVPIIVLTGESSREIDRAAIELGAADYLVKGEITSALLGRAIRHAFDRRRAQQAAQLLSEAGVCLTSSLDCERMLESVARLAVDRFADVCMVDLVDDHGARRRLELDAGERASDEAAKWERDAPMTADPGCVICEALLGREPALVAQVELQKIVSDQAVCDSHRALFARVRPLSFIAVPLIAREHVVGSMLFIAREAGRRYDQEDLVLAEQLAFRAALATENARLYRDTQRAVERRDEVHRVVAHDLRNPLSTVKMVADLLERNSSQGSDLADLRKHLGVQKLAVSRMNRLIEDLLDVARIEAGELSVEAVACSPSTLIRAAIEQHMAQAHARSIRLSSEVEDLLSDVLADEDRIDQVFSNLLSNALKFTPRGGHVELRAYASGDGVTFCVWDDGPGIAHEQLPHLFDRFWQADKAARHGAGLGLAISRGIVEAHGGRIWVESEPGVGTCFSLVLPACAE